LAKTFQEVDIGGDSLRDIEQFGTVWLDGHTFLLDLILVTSIRGRQED
jgi:hypothetical protein